MAAVLTQPAFYQTSMQSFAVPSISAFAAADHCAPASPLQPNTQSSIGAPIWSGMPAPANVNPKYLDHNANTNGAMDVALLKRSISGGAVDTSFPSSSLLFDEFIAPSPSPRHTILPSPSNIYGTGSSNGFLDFANNDKIALPMVSSYGTPMDSSIDLQLPNGSPAMIRFDSSQSKFTPFDDQLDVAPAPVTVKQEYGFSALGSPSSASAASSTFTSDGSLAFELDGGIAALPAAQVWTPPTAMSSVDDSDSVDAVSVDEVDAASDGSVSSANAAMAMGTGTDMAMSPLHRSVNRRDRALTAGLSPDVKALAAAAALRAGPYTRGRAAALAAPAAPRELKPVPVARGPHAGVLGGGEMASVGIYTRDDRWRKIERLREKRRARIVVKSNGGQYACRKAFADRRPRVGGRFVKMDAETKAYLAATKPGAPAVEPLAVPSALLAYHSTATATVAQPATTPLAAAAHAASQSSPYAPLFGSVATPQFAYATTTDVPTAAAAVDTPFWHSLP